MSTQGELPRKTLYDSVFASELQDKHENRILDDFLLQQAHKAYNNSWSGPWSRYTSERDNRPKQMDGTLGTFLNDVELPRSMTSKSGPAVSGSVFIPGGTRARKNVSYVTLIGLDYDGASGEFLDSWIFDRCLPGVTALLHSTWGWATDGKLKWRVWLPLKRPISVEEFDLLLPWVYRTIRHPVDMSCKDPSRLFYTLRTNPDADLPTWYYTRMGDGCLDPDDLPGDDNINRMVTAFRNEQDAKERKRKEDIERKIKEKKRKQLDQTVNGIFHQNKDLQLEGFLRNYANKRFEHAVQNVISAPDGERNTTLNNEAYSCGRFAAEGLLHPQEVERALISAAITNGLPEREAEKTVESGLKAGLAEGRNLDSLKERFHQEKKRRAYNSQQPPAKVSGEGNNDNNSSTPPKGPLGRVDKILYGQDIEERSREIFSWLEANNNPPSLFLHKGELARIIRVNNPNLNAAHTTITMIDSMNAESLKSYLTGRLRFFKESIETDKETGATTTNLKIYELPVNLCKHMLSTSPDILNLPPLESIIMNPCLNPAPGASFLPDGYSPSLRSFVDLGGVTVKHPQNPTDDHVERAKKFILEELYGNFPFADDGSRTNALAMFLLPYVRHMIKGATPLHMVSAPVRGSGKTMLVDCAAIVATGERASIMTEGRDDDEWRKRITSSLLENKAFICLDNLIRKLDSGSLNAALTSAVFGDRILGRSKMVYIQNNAVWCATANNPNLSDEMERRCVFIHLDPMTDRPEERTGFKHHPLRMWTLEEREKLLTAAFVILQYWKNQGMPHSSLDFASFTEYSMLMGGLMDCIGQDYFLANKDKYKDRSDPERSEWQAFVLKWHEAHGTRSVALRELQKLGENEELLETVRGPGEEHSQRIRLGKALRKYQDRVVGHFRIQKDTDCSSRKSKWMVVPISKEQ